MRTWFLYHLKAKNALSLNMATNSAAYRGTFFYYPKKEKNEKYIFISLIFGALQSNKLLFLPFQSHFQVFQPILYTKHVFIASGFVLTKNRSKRIYSKKLPFF